VGKKDLNQRGLEVYDHLLPKRNRGGEASIKTGKEKGSRLIHLYLLLRRKKKGIEDVFIRREGPILYGTSLP